MDVIVPLIAIVVVLVALGASAVAFGQDSRESFEDAPREELRDGAWRSR